MSGGQSVDLRSLRRAAMKAATEAAPAAAAVLERLGELGDHDERGAALTAIARELTTAAAMYAEAGDQLVAARLSGMAAMAGLVASSEARAAARAASGGRATP